MIIFLFRSGVVISQSQIV